MFEVVKQIQNDGVLLHPPRHAYQGKSIVPFGYGVVFTNITRKQYALTDLHEVFPEDRCVFKDEISESAAVTGKKTLSLLEAAHIKPYAEAGPHRIDNGILLRSDQHRLFDLGYFTVTPELRVEVSSRLKEEWNNGREYYAHHGTELRVQSGKVRARPSRDFLVWHNESKFKN